MAEENNYNLDEATADEVVIAENLPMI